MDEKLQCLIADYQANVRRALALMYRSGFAMPSSAWAWVQSCIPMAGELDGGVPYFKHGVGCEVKLAPRPVDFDFGDHGEIDGFDLWRLSKFAEPDLATYGFASIDQLGECFDAANTEGTVRRTGHLYYLAGGERELAVDIDARLPGDLLPGAAHDQILILYTHQFLVADLMLDNYRKLMRRWDKTGKLNRKDEIHTRIYFFTWLAYLFATCEGFTSKPSVRELLMLDRPDSFRDMLPQCRSLGSSISTHFRDLARLRNNVFHVRKSPEHIRNFFDSSANRLAWAEELHEELTKFFSNYRVLCHVHYALHDRKGELRD